jgi:hypothetical protein
MEKSMRFGQKGFYIRIPDLEEEWEPLASDPILYVRIEGTLENNWFDFVIVTIPQEYSWVNISISSIYEISNSNSMFEFYEYENNSLFINYISFHGKCQDYGKLHVEWDMLSDKDGDLVPDIKDDFPDNPRDWIDIDGDGKGDNTDLDIDGDGHQNIEDFFPYDPEEWNDLDGDGVGDNKDRDDDNDGVEDNIDEFPTNPDEWNDTDDDNLGDNKEDPFPNDHDNDGYIDMKDAYPNDPSKWKKENENLNGLIIISICVVITVLVLGFIYIKLKRVIKNRNNKEFK